MNKSVHFKLNLQALEKEIRVNHDLRERRKYQTIIHLKERNRLQRNFKKNSRNWNILKKTMTSRDETVEFSP